MEEIKTVNLGEALADYVSGQEYGTIIHYQEIERICKERRGNQRYYNYIAKAKKILESRGKMIKSIGKGDYQVLYPGDYSNAYTREVRLARGRIKHGGKIINGAPVNDMDATELQEFNRVADFHVSLEAKMCGDFVTVKRLTDRKHPFAVENIQR